MMADKWFLLVLAVFVGGIVPVQGVINAQLGRHLNSPLQASLMSFTGGWLLIALLCCFFGGGLPSLTNLRAAPTVLITGGVFGGVLVTSIILLMPRIGAGALMAGTITGQILFAMLLDHFGFLGTEVRSISSFKIAGCFCLAAGVYLVGKG